MQAKIDAHTKKVSDFFMIEFEKRFKKWKNGERHIKIHELESLQKELINQGLSFLTVIKTTESSQKHLNEITKLSDEITTLRFQLQEALSQGRKDRAGLIL